MYKCKQLGRYRYIVKIHTNSPRFSNDLFIHEVNTGLVKCGVNNLFSISTNIKCHQINDRTISLDSSACVLVCVKVTNTKNVQEKSWYEKVDRNGA